MVIMALFFLLAWEKDDVNLWLNSLHVSSADDGKVLEVPAMAMIKVLLLLIIQIIINIIVLIIFIKNTIILIMIVIPIRKIVITLMTRRKQQLDIDKSDNSGDNNVDNIMHQSLM